MRRNLLVSSAAIALLAGSLIAFGQAREGPTGGSDRPGADRGDAKSDKGRPEPSTRGQRTEERREGGEGSKGAEPKRDGGKEAPKAAEPKRDGGKEAPKAAEPKRDGGKEAPKAAEPKRDGGKEAPKAAEPKRDGGKDAPKAAEPKRDEGKGAPKAAEPKRDGGKDAPKAAEPKRDGGKDAPKAAGDERKDAPKAAEPKRDGGKDAPKAAEPKRDGGAEPRSAEGGERGRVTLTTEQRTQIRETVLRNAPRVNRVNFSINVGTEVPRDVRVVEVPDTIIRIRPEWRGHSYFVHEEEIIVVDRSRRIVGLIEVSEAGGGRERAGAVIRLSDEQRARVRETVLRRGPRAERIDFSLRVGAEVPRSVRLEKVPDLFVELRPEWRDFLFFIYNDQIIVVDSSHRIVAIIDV